MAYYVYSKDKNIGLHFKALSNHVLFIDNTVFISFSQPPEGMFQGMSNDMLPMIGFVKKLDPDFVDGSISQTPIPAESSYDITLYELVKQADMLEAYNELMGIQSTTASKIERNFGEITTTAEFKTRCLSYKKGCAIGLLPANLMIDYEKDNFNEHLNVL